MQVFWDGIMPRTITLLGNRCGHDPRNPRFYAPPSHHKKRKPFLDKAAHRIAEAYHDPLKFDIAPLFFHTNKINKRGGYRKKRSEIMEAITNRVGRYILHHVSLATMILGWYVKELNTYHNMSYKSIAAGVGISESQLERVMTTFIAAGYIHVEQRHEHVGNGKFKHLTPIIRVSPQLFIDLGFDKAELKFHVERAKEELDKQMAKAQRNAKPTPSLLFIPKAKKKNSDITFQRSGSLRDLAAIMSSIGKKLNPNTS